MKYFFIYKKIEGSVKIFLRKFDAYQISPYFDRNCDKSLES